MSKILKKERCLLTNTKNAKLELKKKILAAWSKLLLDTGEIDIKKYNRMLVLIDRLTA